ncbi:flocculation protein FLO11-like [Pecten maximus]|uniref:flocculation protein FLO11-like n=1 Tax=Pecten maximus TaxID=6579 RepID=UPI0014587554|nr:flocculation protein FLO11-like [Pecten maximus]
MANSYALIAMFILSFIGTARPTLGSIPDDCSIIKDSDRRFYIGSTDRHCLVYHEQSTSKTFAAAFCPNGQLLEIRSQTEQDQLAAVIAGRYYNDVWLGLTKVNGQWKWDSENCAVLSFPLKEWRAVQCDGSHSFICQYVSFKKSFSWRDSLINVVITVKVASLKHFRPGIKNAITTDFVISLFMPMMYRVPAMSTSMTLDVFTSPSHISMSSSSDFVHQTGELGIPQSAPTDNSAQILTQQSTPLSTPRSSACQMSPTLTTPSKVTVTSTSSAHTVTDTTTPSNPSSSTASKHPSTHTTTSSNQPSSPVSTNPSTHTTTSSNLPSSPVSTNPSTHTTTSSNQPSSPVLTNPSTSTTTSSNLPSSPVSTNPSTHTTTSSNQPSSPVLTNPSTSTTTSSNLPSSPVSTNPSTHTTTSSNQPSSPVSTNPSTHTTTSSNQPSSPVLTNPSTHTTTSSNLPSSPVLINPPTSTTTLSNPLSTFSTTLSNPPLSHTLTHPSTHTITSSNPQLYPASSHTSTHRLTPIPSTNPSLAPTTSSAETSSIPISTATPRSVPSLTSTTLSTPTRESPRSPVSWPLSTTTHPLTGKAVSKNPSTVLGQLTSVSMGLQRSSTDIKIINPETVITTTNYEINHDNTQINHSDKLKDKTTIISANITTPSPPQQGQVLDITPQGPSLMTAIALSEQTVTVDESSVNSISKSLVTLSAFFDNASKSTTTTSRQLHNDTPDNKLVGSTEQFTISNNLNNKKENVTTREDIKDIESSSMSVVFELSTTEESDNNFDLIIAMAVGWGGVMGIIVALIAVYIYRRRRRHSPEVQRSINLAPSIVENKMYGVMQRETTNV